MITTSRPNQGKEANKVAEETQRRRSLFDMLQQEYFLSHDGLTPAEIAGTEITPREAEWINTRLNEKGESWTVSATPPPVPLPAPIVTVGPVATGALRGKVEKTTGRAPQVEQAVLVIRFSENQPYRVERKPYRVFRVGIYNSGTLVADNVMVKLVNIKPKPRDSMYGADFPYPMFTSTGNESVRINPHDEELFAVAETWLSGDGRLIVDGINKKLWQQAHMAIQIDKDEVWHLTLRATAANAKRTEVTLEMRPESESAVSVTQVSR